MPIGRWQGYQMASRIDNGYQSFSRKAGSHLLFLHSHLSPRWKCSWSSFNHWLTFFLSPILSVSFIERIPHRFRLSCPCNTTPQREWLFHLPGFHLKTPRSKGTLRLWQGKFREQHKSCYIVIMQVETLPWWISKLKRMNRVGKQSSCLKIFKFLWNIFSLKFKNTQKFVLLCKLIHEEKSGTF